jgi:hypothetical protein
VAMDGDSKRAADQICTMAKHRVTLRSPKGLIGVTERPAGKGEGFKVEKISPPAFKWTARDVTGDTIRAHIAVLRNWVTFIGFGDDDEATPPELPRKRDRRVTEAVTFADRADWARRVLKRLDDVERDLIDVEESSDTDAVRRHAFTAIYNAVVLSSEIHNLTVADNEAAIFTGTRISRGLKAASEAANKRRKTAQSSEWTRWNAEAHNIWERHPKLSRQAVAAQIRTNLRLAVKVRTIAKRLTIPVTAR